jgi:SAM-dependent methyltransferase
VSAPIPDPDARSRQREHWAATFANNPDMYGSSPSESARGAGDAFRGDSVRRILELGSGQGRDTLFLAQQGFEIVALDYVDAALDDIASKASEAGVAPRVTTAQHDVRDRLPFPDESFDASYSHMLFCMALTTSELEGLAAELRRVLRPGGIVVYTVRHTGDAHFAAGTAHGDDMYENGGFIVHFFDRELVERLAEGFEILEVAEFTEGDLPRELWRVTMRRIGS